MSTETFAVGDVVYLKSGSVGMTVTALRGNLSCNLEVQWMWDGDLRKVQLDRNVFTKTPTSNNHPAPAFIPAFTIKN